jgi:hypothetical protein
MALALGGKRVSKRLLSRVGPKIACGFVALEAEKVGVWTKLLVVTQCRSYIGFPIQKPVVSKVDEECSGEGGHESQGSKR